MKHVLLSVLAWLAVGATLVLAQGQNPDQGQGQDQAQARGKVKTQFADVGVPEEGYAIVYSQAVAGDSQWLAVVNALEAKYKDRYAVKKFTWSENVQEAFPKLAEFKPKFTCLVALPTEADNKFVQTVHICTRMLDNDIYTDTVWAILTGYEAADALKIAEAKPITVTQGAGGCGIALDKFDSGICFDEGRQRHYQKKNSGETAKDYNDGPEDSTHALAKAFDECQLFITSGHATERDWQPGYSYRNGCFISEKGQMYGRLLDGSRFEINSANPKIWLPAGNCLIGHIADMNSMALAAIHSGSVYQMSGYIVPTWFGYMGWGVQCYYINQPGRFTYAESVFASNQALTYKFAQYLKLPVRPSQEEVQKAVEGFKDLSNEDKQQVQGLNYDQNVFAIYGDPAWQNTLNPDLPKGWTQDFKKETLEKKAGVEMNLWSFTVTPAKTESPYGAVNGGRPIFAFLPQRISADAAVVDKNNEPANPLGVVITDDFILLPTESLPADQPTTIRILAK